MSSTYLLTVATDSYRDGLIEEAEIERLVKLARSSGHSAGSRIHVALRRLVRRVNRTGPTPGANHSTQTSQPVGQCC